MKKILSMILVICMVIGLAAGCNSTETSNGSGESDGTLASRINPDDEYIAVCCLNNLEYFNAHKYGWEKTGEMFGVKTSWVGPTDDDVSAMVRNCR